jgi:hypothetical protein
MDTHRKIVTAALQDHWSEPVRERDRPRPDVVRDMAHDRARIGRRWGVLMTSSSRKAVRSGRYHDVDRRKLVV